MPTSQQFAGELLAHILNNAAVADIGDAGGLRASVTEGSLWLQLLESGGETAYTGYARVELLRDGSAWSISGRRANLAAAVEFGENTGGEVTITAVAIGTAASGGKTLYTGTLPSPMVVQTGRIPRVPTSAYIEA